MVSVALTAIYMFRLYFLVFHGSFRGSDHAKSHLHESPLNMTLPLVVLAVLSIVGGMLNLPGIIFHSGTHWLSHYLELNTVGLNLIHPMHLESSQAMLLMGGATVLSLGILLVSFVVYVKRSTIAKNDDQLSGWEMLSAKKLYFDEIYNFLFVKPTEWLSKQFHSIIEIGILNKSINGITLMLSHSGELIRKWQSGMVASYLLWMVLGIVGMVLYYLIKF
jgi:NADH-quinone oxidoreductase subunit L